MMASVAVMLGGNAAGVPPGRGVPPSQIWRLTRRSSTVPRGSCTSQGADSTRLTCSHTVGVTRSTRSAVKPPRTEYDRAHAHVRPEARGTGARGDGPERAPRASVGPGASRESTVRIWSEARSGEGTVGHERSEATRAEAPVRRPEIRGRMQGRMQGRGARDGGGGMVGEGRDSARG